MESGNSAESVTAHLATSMLILAATVFMFIRSRYPAVLPKGGGSQRITLVVAFAGSFGVYYVFHHWLDVFLPLSSIEFLENLGL